MEQLAELILNVLEVIAGLFGLAAAFLCVYLLIKLIKFKF